MNFFSLIILLTNTKIFSQVTNIDKIDHLQYLDNGQWRDLPQIPWEVKHAIIRCKNPNEYVFYRGYIYHIKEVAVGRIQSFKCQTRLEYDPKETACKMSDIKYPFTRKDHAAYVPFKTVFALDCLTSTEDVVAVCEENNTYKILNDHQICSEKLSDKLHCTTDQIDTLLALKTDEYRIVENKYSRHAFCKNNFKYSFNNLGEFILATCDKGKFVYCYTNNTKIKDISKVCPPIIRKSHSLPIFVPIICAIAAVVIIVAAIIFCVRWKKKKETVEQNVAIMFY